MEKRKENAINFAIKSALSKFDSPKVYIERGEEATEEFITMITDEVIKDIKETEDEQNIKSIYPTFLASFYLIPRRPFHQNQFLYCIRGRAFIPLQKI